MAKIIFDDGHVEEFSENDSLFVYRENGNHTGIIKAMDNEGLVDFNDPVNFPILFMFLAGDSDLAQDLRDMVIEEIMEYSNGDPPVVS